MLSYGMRNCLETGLIPHLHLGPDVQLPGSPRDNRNGRNPGKQARNYYTWTENHPKTGGFCTVFQVNDSSNNPDRKKEQEVILRIGQNLGAQMMGVELMEKKPAKIRVPQGYVGHVTVEFQGSHLVNHRSPPRPKRAP